MDETERWLAERIRTLEETLWRIYCLAKESPVRMTCAEIPAILNRAADGLVLNPAISQLPPAWPHYHNEDCKCGGHIFKRVDGQIEATRRCAAREYRAMVEARAKANPLLRHMMKRGDE